MDTWNHFFVFELLIVFKFLVKLVFLICMSDYKFNLQYVYIIRGCELSSTCNQFLFSLKALQR